jgi:hypothetical protein
MSALVTLRSDAGYMLWTEEPDTRGKNWKVIHVAVMHKSIHIVYDDLKPEESYDLHKTFPRPMKQFASFQIKLVPTGLSCPRSTLESF